jgi:hypothetical protein
MTHVNEINGMENQEESQHYMMMEDLNSGVI